MFNFRGIRRCTLFLIHSSTSQSKSTMHDYMIGTKHFFFILLVTLARGISEKTGLQNLQNENDCRIKKAQPGSINENGKGMV